MSIRFDFVLSDDAAEDLIDIIRAEKLSVLIKLQEYNSATQCLHDPALRIAYSRRAEHLNKLEQIVLNGQYLF